MKKPKRNPQDLTLRNLRALKKRIERLEQWCEAITFDIDEMYSHLKSSVCRISLRARQIAEESSEQLRKVITPRKKK